MMTGWAQGRKMVMAIALAGSGLAALPQAVSAQTEEARLRKIESEIRALQRTVFPGGDGRFFTPEVIVPDQASQGQGGATTAVTDILGRLDSMEAQLQRLTAQTEENSNAVAQMAARVEALEASENARLAAQQPVFSAPTPTPTPAPATAVSTPTPTLAAAATTRPSQPAAAPSAARIAAVSQILKPQTGDAGEDEYTYGFRLWDAKFYPEARQQLQLYIDRYPRHTRISFARNLLGRAFLDDGKTAEAASWFLKNYQEDKAGARAPDSLLFLAETMIAAKDTNRACLALAEFSEAYPAIATGRLQAQYNANLSKVKCN